MKIEIEEDERQFILLSLALCALLRPGFDRYASEIAEKLNDGRRAYGSNGIQLFDAFKKNNSDVVKPQKC